MTLKRKQIINISLFISIFFIVTLNISDISANPSIPIKTVKIINVNAGKWTWPDKSKIMSFKAETTALKDSGREVLKKHQEIKTTKVAPCPINIVLKTMNEQTPVNKYISSDGDLKITINRELLDYELGTSTSSFDFKTEPSIAANDEHILITGNRFSSISDDRGASFAYLDVQRSFWVSQNQNEEFQGDQVAIYSNKQKCFIWAQLWNEDQNDVPTYFVRLIVAKRLVGGELYAMYDFKPSVFVQESWKNLSFDFPDLAVCQNSLYMSISIMESPEKGTDQSLVIRIPLDKIANYEDSFDAEYCTITGYCPRLTQGESETMFFATLDYNDWDQNNKWDKIRIYEWKWDKQKIVVTDLDIEEWGDAYESIGPDGESWLGSMGANITAAWISPDELNRTNILGFAWTAGRDDSHPYPHIRVAFIKPNEKGEYEVFAQPHMWNASFAFAYPSICANKKGQIGISLFFGGNILYPSHAVGIYNTMNKRWKINWTALGTDCPNVNEWGDYLTIRPHPTKNNAWITAGFTLNGGPRTKDLSIKFIQFESK